MKKLLITLLFYCFYQNAPAQADCMEEICGRWVGQTTVANNDEPDKPFIDVGMIMEITATEKSQQGGRLFVGSVEFIDLAETSRKFDLTGLTFGNLIKASTVGTVLSAVLNWDKTTMQGYYLDTLLIPNTRAHPQAGKFVLEKETDEVP